MGLGATARHVKSSTFDWRFSLFILVAGLPGVVLGASIILQVDERLAQGLLGLLTFSLGVYSWFRPKMGQVHSAQNRTMIGYFIGGGFYF